jgi:branched-subunit amino acid aminotransferase/4-amino-4-deoxychorismate lyase
MTGQMPVVVINLGFSGPTARYFMSGAASMSLPIHVSRNGVLIDPAEACVPVFNPAIFGAYGIYESIQVSNGVVFALEPHLQRLAHSASLLEMALPADLPTFMQWIAEVQGANGCDDCTMRLFVIGAEDGAGSVAYIWPQPPTVYPPEYYIQGASAITFPGQRFMPEAKSINTLASFLARRKAQSARAHEALLTHDGTLTEGANSNLFAVVDDLVLTPPSDQVLAGVTRDILMVLARSHGFEVREAGLPVTDLNRWTECFITSTSRHVMPITTVDGRPIGEGEVGPLTRRLTALYEDLFARATTAGSSAG